MWNFRVLVWFNLTTKVAGGMLRVAGNPRLSDLSDNPVFYTGVDYTFILTLLITLLRTQMR